MAPRFLRFLVVLFPALGSRGSAQRVERDSVAVYVASRSLPRGTVLQPSDMVRDVRTARRGAPDAVPHAGWVTRRVIRAGEVLAAPAVVPPPTIAIGQRVEFVVTRGGVELTLPATAAFSATLGDTVTVRLGSLRRATGVVAGPARVIALTSDTDR